MVLTIQVQRHTTKVQIKDWDVVSIKSYGCNMDINVTLPQSLIYAQACPATRKNNYIVT